MDAARHRVLRVEPLLRLPLTTIAARGLPIYPKMKRQKGK